MLKAGFRDSIFVKLLWIYLGTVLVVTALVIGFMQLIAPSGKGDRASKDRHRAMYLGLLADRFGAPPDLEEARRLADSLGIQVRMEGPDGEWSTWEGLPSLDELEEEAFRHSEEPATRFGMLDGRRFTLIERGGNRFLFFFSSSPFRETRVEWIAVLLVLVAAILFLSYALVLRLFRPLEWLNEGVREAARGNLGHDVAIAGRGELSELSRAFNDMIGRIREMIKAREQLLLDVSHELKSPITRIKVALELGKGNLPAVVRRNVGEMETMVTELLETARLDSGRGSLSLAPADPAELVREAVQPFQESVPGVRLDAPPGLPRVELDAKRVRSVIRNLVENALKYSAHQERPVEASLRARDGRLELIVRDYGYGIPASDLDSVFEPFYRVDKSRNRDTGGYGLGLSLCRKIMEAHGGGISLASEEGRGTTATAWFRT